MLFRPLILACILAVTAAQKDKKKKIVSLGPRPYFLVDTMAPSFLKTKLAKCAATKTEFKQSDFSIGHRGAPMMFPEHTEASWKAAGLMGAGIIECDVTFTKDTELVCRHAQCDLHTTTDVVLRPEMNAKCTTPWAPGVSPKCCTTDFTLAEIKTLCAKMDSSGGSAALTAQKYVYGGTADWRTDLYQVGCPKVVTHKESIQIIKSLGGKFTPELKSPEVPMPFMGTFSQEDYAQKLIDEYVAARVPPKNVWPQSFYAPDVYYWVANTDYGAQAVALDPDDTSTEAEVEDWINELVANGVQIVAPPMWRLVDPAPGPLKMGPSHYALYAKAAGLDIITWTLERTPPGLQGYYWQTLNAGGVSLVDGDNYALLYVLAYQVGILGIFLTGLPLSHSLPTATT
ncbi:glycerophosphodiester phosphodiesterase [Fragilaria crotonensis]|nr:glycerophosphodiester phosphodiesterase [Fragilaria crotonensis]